MAEHESNGAAVSDPVPEKVARRLGRQRLALDDRTKEPPPVLPLRKSTRALLDLLAERFNRELAEVVNGARADGEVPADYGLDLAAKVWRKAHTPTGPS